MSLPKFVLAVSAALCLLIPVSTLADWDIGDSHKMHYPQRPDTHGLDVKFRYRLVLADDWRCSQSDAVTDIHFWFSCLSDYEPNIELIHVSIHEDIPESPPEFLYSRPGPLLWSRNFGVDDVRIREYARGLQGWYNPQNETYLPDDHEIIYQCNIEDISDPFMQDSGTVYWLDLSIISENPVGWKTSLDTFHDNAVWGEFATPGPTCVDWDELIYPEGHPLEGTGMDLAFVITGDSWWDNFYDMNNDDEVKFEAATDILPNHTVQLHAMPPASGGLFKKATFAVANIVWARLDIQIGSIDQKGFAPVTVVGGGGRFAPYVWGGVPVGASDFSFISGSGRIHWASGDINITTDINVSANGFADIRARATGLGSIDFDTDVVTLFAGSMATGTTIIPTTTTWGILGVVFLLLLSGTVIFIKRRRAGVETSTPRRVR